MSTCCTTAGFSPVQCRVCAGVEAALIKAHRSFSRIPWGDLLVPDEELAAMSAAGDHDCRYMRYAFVFLLPCNVYTLVSTIISTAEMISTETYGYLTHSCCMQD